MRKVESTRLELGNADIGAVHINPKSREDVPALLHGLPRLYVTAELRGQVFTLLEAEVNPNARKDTGRPSVHLWRILVLAVLKQGLNCDYDQLTELANEHGTLRKIMQHNYERQTIVDNVSLLSPQLLAKVSQLLVQSGHEVVRKKAWRNLSRAR